MTLLPVPKQIPVLPAKKRRPQPTSNTRKYIYNWLIKCIPRSFSVSLDPKFTPRKGTIVIQGRVQVQAGLAVATFLPNTKSTNQHEENLRYKTDQLRQSRLTITFMKHRTCYADKHPCDTALHSSMADKHELTGSALLKIRRAQSWSHHQRRPEDHFWKNMHE